MKLDNKMSVNFFLNQETVAEMGEAICSTMSEADTCMSKAVGVINEIEALAASVPGKAKCDALLAACSNTLVGMKSTVFSAYGIRAKNSLLELVEYSEQIDMEAARELGDVRERMFEIQRQTADLRNQLVFCRNEKSNKMNLSNRYRASNLQENVVERGGKISLTEQAAKLAGVFINKNGIPIINNATDARNYTECLNNLKNGKYSNTYIAARMSGTSVNKNGVPIINSAMEAESYNLILKKLSIKSYSNELVNYIKRAETLRLEAYNDGKTIGYGFDIIAHPDIVINYNTDGTITKKEADRLLGIILDEEAEALNDFLEKNKLKMDQNVYDAAMDILYNRHFNAKTEEVLWAMARREDERVLLLLDNFDYNYAYTYLYPNSIEDSEDYVNRNPGLRDRREEEYLIYKNGFNDEGEIIDEE